MMKRVLLSAAALALMASGMTSASASHPTQMCLDIDPDRASPTSNDDIVDSIWAYPGSTDDGHPPQYEGCVTERTGPDQDWTDTEIDFEITGVADPDGQDSDSPETPDLTCTVSGGAGGCAAYPPSSGGGQQTIRAWIDFDKDDATLEGVDLAEGWDEDADSGTHGEPDMTDVALWDWTHGDPPIDCRDDQADCVKSATYVTFRYRERTFSGRVTSDLRDCIRRRLVTVQRLRQGPDEVVASTHSGIRGWWSMSVDDLEPGRYRAKVSKSAVPDAVCEKERSRWVRI